MSVGGIRELMRTVCVVLVVCVCSVVGLAKSGQTNASAMAPTAFEQTLINAERSYIDASKKADVAFFKRTLTGDFSLVSYDGEISDRQDMLDQFADGGVDILPYEMKVVPVGEGVAIVTYNVVYRVPPAEDEGPPPRYQHFSTVWVKQGDIWKMKFQQRTPAHWGDW